MGRNDIRRRKLYEEIASEIERRIHAGDYAPGDHLPSERKIMEEFGVGRPAVREALFALSKMGLVLIRSGERAVVTSPTPDVLIQELSGAARSLMATRDGVRMFQDARVLLEVALVRHAAVNATPDDIAELKEALDANRVAVNDRHRFNETDNAFHAQIVSIARNTVIDATYSGLSEWLFEQRQIAMLHPGSPQHAVEAHTRIFEAIAAKDPDAAEAAMRAHLDGVIKQYWSVWEARLSLTE
ncbi:FCD domain-containing protein [Antarcticimicrobium luteum]|uniref:FCD domain-containing protein n=1 Tax=Antarcticimicrobium luteum TaxID=2547397 RepID=A0A4R5V2D6_9RHOB|nr:FCD domain-containing protein [Antarcticimicrobium luteum]TDK45645.1 FCD domain-containing protein [Antarcticimicrobium luteum]